MTSAPSRMPETASSGAVHAHRHPPRRIPTGRAIGIGVGNLALLVLIDAFAPNLFAKALPARAQAGQRLDQAQGIRRADQPAVDAMLRARRRLGTPVQPVR